MAHTIVFARDGQWRIEISEGRVSIGHSEHSFPFEFERRDFGLLVADISRLLVALDEGEAPPIAVTPS